MIAFALALLQVVPAPAPTTASEGSDLTVTAERLRKLQLDLSLDVGQFRSCSVKVSSGDRFIDGVACRQARACVPKMRRMNLMSCINTGIGMAVAQERLRVEERADAKD